MDEKQLKINEKINQTKANFALLFPKFCYFKNSGMKLKDIIKQLKITYKTAQKWRYKVEFIDKIRQVTLDRAFNEMIFKKKEQIQCFEYLKLELNFWSTYEEVAKNINISRYHYKQVRDYIIEELKTV